jgi:hypothetical protein
VRIRFRLGKEHSVMSGIMHIDTMRSTKARVPSLRASAKEGRPAGWDAPRPLLSLGMGKDMALISAE